MTFFAENPFLMLICLIACWPGLIPIGVAFYLGRRYDWRSPLVQRGDREIEV